jgi:hypothetical protein
VKVVIVGSRTRDEQQDKALVDNIIDSCKERFAKVIFVTKSCDKGVGKLIYDRCKLPTKTGGRPEFDMIEVTLRHMLHEHELPRHEFLGHFNSLNAALAELGDEFHVLTEEKPTGAMVDMVNRIESIGAPYATYTTNNTTAKIPGEKS